MATKVTDPALLAELEGSGPVTDPAILAQLEAAPVSASTAAGRGAAQGATLGWYDEMRGAVEAGGAKPDEPASIYKLLGGLFGLGKGDEKAKAAYEQARNRVRGEAEQAQSERPGMYLGGQLAGGIGATLPLAPLMTGATAAGTVGRGIAGGAILGGTQGAGEASTPEDMPRAAGVGALIGGAVGGAVPAVIQGARRVITPAGDADPARRALVDALSREGVDTTAGQKTGSRFIRYLESSANDMPFIGGGMDDAMRAQKEQFTAAALKRVGTNSNRATTDVMDATLGRISQQFDDISSRNVLKYDSQFANDLTSVVKEYGSVLPSHQKDFITKTLQDLAQQPGGMYGKMYQATRSRLTKMARSNRNSDPNFSDALRGLRDALDKAMDRSILPADAGKWSEARRLYGNYKTLERAMASAGADTQQGLLSPQQLAAALRADDKGRYVTGKGDFAELARAGAGIMDPLPNSGTAPRLMAQQIITGLAPAAIGGATGYANNGDITGAAAGAVGGALLARALLSPAGQSYLANQGLAGAGGANRRAVEFLLSNAARQQAVERQPYR